MKLFGYEINIKNSRKMRDDNVPVDVFDDAGLLRAKVKEYAK